MGVCIAKRVTRMLIFVIDLNIAHTGELLHRLCQWLSDAVASAVGAADAGQVDVQRSPVELDAPVADKAVPHGDDAAPLFLRIGALKVLVQGRSDRIDGCRDFAGDWVVERRDTLINLLRIRKVNRDTHRNWRPCGGRGGGRR